MQKDSIIYVAGHTGLVGSAILRELQRQGYLNILTRTSSELDLRIKDQVDSFFKTYKPEYVFLCAAKVGGILANKTYPGQFIYNNLMIQTNVIHACQEENVKKLVFLGSSCIYPKDAFSMCCSTGIDETMLMNGPLEETNSAYAVAKIAGIEMCKAYAKQYGLRCTCIMPTNLYGIGDNFDLETSHVLPALITKIRNARDSNNKKIILWGTGNPLREFLYADDLAELCINVCVNEKSSLDFEIYNAGCGKDYSIKELAEMICILLGYKGDIVFDSKYPDGTFQKRLNVEKVKREYQWQATTSLEDGIRKVLNYYGW